MPTTEARPFSRNQVRIPLSEDSASASEGTCGTSDSSNYSPSISQKLESAVIRSPKTHIK